MDRISNITLDPVCFGDAAGFLKMSDGIFCLLLAGVDQCSIQMEKRRWIGWHFSFPCAAVQFIRKRISRNVFEIRVHHIRERNLQNIIVAHLRYTVRINVQWKLIKIKAVSHKIRFKVVLQQDQCMLVRDTILQDQLQFAETLDRLRELPQIKALHAHHINVNYQ